MPIVWLSNVENRCFDSRKLFASSTVNSFDRVDKLQLELRGICGDNAM